LTSQQKLEQAAEYDFTARAEIARDVASHYPRGDYLEFGSAGFSTLRNFLTAFDIHCGARFPDLRFYAFDVFGNPDHNPGPPPAERAYACNIRQLRPNLQSGGRSYSLTLLEIGTGQDPAVARRG
jgi:hypothetical protein